MTEGTISSPISRRSSALSIRGILVVALFAALWGILWWQLSGEWSVNDQYSYGWFVPLFAIVLFWLRWEDAPQPHAAAEAPNSKLQAPRLRSAIGIAIVALLLLFPIRPFEIGN